MINFMVDFINLENLFFAMLTSGDVELLCTHITCTFHILGNTQCAGNFQYG